MSYLLLIIIQTLLLRLLLLLLSFLVVKLLLIHLLINVNIASVAFISRLYLLSLHRARYYNCTRRYSQNIHGDHLITIFDKLGSLLRQLKDLISKLFLLRFGSLYQRQMKSVGTTSDLHEYLLLLLLLFHIRTTLSRTL